MNKLIKIVLCMSMFLMLFGCQQETELDTSADETAEPVEQEEIPDYPSAGTDEIESFYKSEKASWGVSMYDNPSAVKAYEKYRDFCNRYLINAVEENDNEIISPLSLYYVLAILANGASGDTRRQLENALGMNVTDLNNFLKDIETVNNDRDGDKYKKANSLLFNTHHGLSLSDDYVNTIREYYGDSIEQYDFGDGSGIADKVNSWAARETDNAINNIVENDDFNDLTSFLILNALAAGDKWDVPFETGKTYYEEFNNYDNTKSMVEMMHQTFLGYWHDDLSEGFCKRLVNQVSVVGIVPNVGVDIYDYINQLQPDTIAAFTNIYTYYTNEEFGDYGCTADLNYTNLSFPKFEYEKEYDLDKALKKMGLKDLYDYQTCDFSAMAKGDQSVIDELCLQKAKQKCTILVDEEHIEAAAVTVAYGGLGGDGCNIRDTYYHDVVFNRPFLFAIIYNLSTYSPDLATPLFIGVVTKLGEPVEKAMQIENITGAINIRSKPSTKGEKLGTFTKGSIIFAFETKEAEGYTWYRIGTDKWVADKGGEWIKVLKQY